MSTSKVSSSSGPSSRTDNRREVTERRAEVEREKRQAEEEREDRESKPIRDSRRKLAEA